MSDIFCPHLSDKSDSGQIKSSAIWVLHGLPQPASLLRNDKHGEFISRRIAECGSDSQLATLNVPLPLQISTIASASQCSPNFFTIRPWRVIDFTSRMNQWRE